MSPIQSDRSVGVTIAMVLLTGMALISSLAVGFFVFPFVLAALAIALFYWAVRHQGVRNPLAPPDIGPSGTWSDGAPLDRALEHQTQARAAADVYRLDDEANDAHRRFEEAERAEELKRTDPRDFQGPPPFVPFP